MKIDQESDLSYDRATIAHTTPAFIRNKKTAWSFILLSVHDFS